MQLTLIFITLLVHLLCVDRCRSGIYMMKYSLCHPEEFTHPHIAFLMGLIEYYAMIIAELINIMRASQKTDPQNLIGGYIGFNAIVNIPVIYLSALNNLPIKGAIGKVQARRARKEIRGDDE